MKFLYEKVYSNQYFALVLFGTIAILLILFAIVLLAAIKDTKKRKLAQLDKQEKESIDALQDKVNVMSNDEEIFGVTEAFKEESKESPLEFFKSEDEESKTRDIVLSPPTTENSMNNLLNEFEDEKQEEIVNDISIVDNSNTFNEEIKQQDIVVPNIVVPTPSNEPVMETAITTPESLISEENVPIQNVVPDVSISQPNYEENAIDETILPAKEEKIEQIKEEKTILDESEDEFELPAIKNVNLEKTIMEDDINASGIDFGKTGILNFSNIENETYEIK